MFKSISYVIKENCSNFYRIFCIAKYELLSDMRDSKFGIFGILHLLRFKCLLIGLYLVLPGEEKHKHTEGLLLSIYLGLLWHLVCGGIFVHVLLMDVRLYFQRQTLSQE